MHTRAIAAWLYRCPPPTHTQHTQSAVRCLALLLLLLLQAGFSSSLTEGLDDFGPFNATALAEKALVKANVPGLVATAVSNSNLPANVTDTFSEGGPLLPCSHVPLLPTALALRLRGHVCNGQAV